MKTNSGIELCNQLSQPALAPTAAAFGAYLGTSGDNTAVRPLSQDREYIVIFGKVQWDLVSVYPPAAQRNTEDLRQSRVRRPSFFDSEMSAECYDLEEEEHYFQRRMPRYYVQILKVLHEIRGSSNIRHMEERLKLCS